MTINHTNLLRKATPRSWRNNTEIRNFIEQLIFLLSQTATATGDSGEGGDTITINEAESEALPATARIQNLESIAEDLARMPDEVDYSMFDSRIEDIERQLIDIWSGADTGFKSVNVQAGTCEATDREFITAELNAIILLPSRPVADSVIIVKKIDNSRLTTIGGNGKVIYGSSSKLAYSDSICIRNLNTSLTFQYSIAKDAWIIR
jgi:hypothetical protein